VREVGEAPPFSGFERTIAARYLRARRKEGFISVIAGFSFVGIALGVATLIIVMAVMNGFRTELLSKILGFTGHVTVLADRAGGIADFDAAAAALRTAPGVTSAIPYVEGQVMVSSQRQATGALVRGMREADLKSLPSVNNGKLRGTLEGFDKSGGIAIGWRMAWKHGVSLGDNLTLISPEGPETVMGSAPRIRAYPVVAIFDIGMSDYDNSVVYMPFAEAQEYFVQEDGATAIEVMVDKPDAVEERIAGMKDKTSGLQFLSWRRTNETFFNALQVERNVMFLILTLIILVAALNIISGLIMLVKDKGGDIAIMRTMGATQGSVMRIFLITGAAIGVVGTIAGFLMGLVVCMNVESIRQFLSWMTRTELFSPELYFLSRLPAEMDVGETTAVVVMALTLSLLATLYPSWRAARLDPVEALRYE
jgi:lipoprotein-releasing system permease protein